MTLQSYLEGWEIGGDRMKGEKMRIIEGKKWGRIEAEQ